MIIVAYWACGIALKQNLSISVGEYVCKGLLEHTWSIIDGDMEVRLRHVSTRPLKMLDIVTVLGMRASLSSYLLHGSRVPTQKCTIGEGSVIAYAVRHIESTTRLL